MEKLKIVFMGTPAFACAILSSLINSPYEVVGVVSQPDKKVGRKQILQKTAVKVLAEEHHIPVLQPIKIRDNYDAVLALQPDLIVTCAYGQMIPEVVLQTPTFGSLNVHASLLPKLRGGAPIHKAIIYGESESGVSIMRMVKKMDAGDYMLQKKVAIELADTAGSLQEKLMTLGSQAILEAIPLLVSGKAVFTKQDERQATFAYNITREEEYIDANQDYREVYNHMRGLIPWPVGYIFFHDKKLKIHEVKWSDLKSDVSIGTLFLNDNRLYLSCLNGSVEICEVQLEGKNKASASAFINGNKTRLSGEI